MNENTENKKLPYPKMDIDFLRSETHHRGVGHYYSDIVMKIHCLVRYKCCFCGAENTDDEQFFELRKNVHAYGPSSLSEKEEQIVRDIKNQTGRQTAFRKERDIEARAYELLDLKCSCAQCGKKQPWSDFRPASGFFGWLKKRLGDWGSVICASILLLAAIVILFAHLPLAGAAALVLLFVPSLAALAHNKRTQKKSLELKEEFRPEISIVYRPEAETRKDS